MSALVRLRRSGLLAARILKRALNLTDTVYVEDRVAEYRGYWAGGAARLSAEFRDLAAKTWEVRVGEAVTRISNHVTEADNPVTLQLAGDKAFCIELAREAGLPVAALGCFALKDFDEMVSLQRQAGGPLVVKPASGSSSGLGITTLIESRREMKRAILLASLHSPSILVERYVPAESCRLLFLDGRLVHAVRRAGPRVTGDGSSTVAGLLRQNGWSDLIGDRAAALTLASQGATLDTIPPEGSTTLVCHAPPGQQQRRELRTVYNESITDLIGPELEDEATRLIRALRCQFAGVDLLTNDPGASLKQGGGVFLEVNTTPGIHHHYQTAAECASHPVATRVLQYLLARDDQRMKTTASQSSGDDHRDRP